MQNLMIKASGTFFRTVSLVDGKSGLKWILAVKQKKILIHIDIHLCLSVIHYVYILHVITNNKYYVSHTHTHTLYLTHAQTRIYKEITKIHFYI